MEERALSGAAAAYDLDGNMVNAVVNDAKEGADGAPPAMTPTKAYRMEQEIDVALATVSIRVAVEDANTGRIGAMEIKLPLLSEKQPAAADPGKAQPAQTN